MSILKVAARHAYGPAENGYGGCHVRWANDGVCSGYARAKWLNELGDDDEPYRGGTHGVTNLTVRLNWLRGDSHIV